MKTFYFLISIYAIFLPVGCGKNNQQDCSYQYTAGVINDISGPDSILVNEQYELTLDVTAPGLCVADVKVTITRITDSIYYLDATVKHNSTGGNGNCACEVKDHHFVRLYFSSPVTGIISLSATPGIGPSAGHTVKVH